MLHSSDNINREVGIGSHGLNLGCDPLASRREFECPSGDSKLLSEI